MRSFKSILSDRLHKKGISQANLAERLNESPQNLGKKLGRNGISMELILQISKAINHNFFYEIAVESGIKFIAPEKMDSITIDDLLEHKVNKLLHEKRYARPYRLSDIDPAQLNEPNVNRTDN